MPNPINKVNSPRFYSHVFYSDFKDIFKNFMDGKLERNGGVIALTKLAPRLIEEFLTVDERRMFSREFREYLRYPDREEPDIAELIRVIVDSLNECEFRRANVMTDRDKVRIARQMIDKALSDMASAEQDIQLVGAPYECLADVYRAHTRKLLRGFQELALSPITWHEYMKEYIKIEADVLDKKLKEDPNLIITLGDMPYAAHQNDVFTDVSDPNMMVTTGEQEWKRPNWLDFSWDT